jgi:ATP-dependent RNA helicase RhlB
MKTFQESKTKKSSSTAIQSFKNQLYIKVGIMQFKEFNLHPDLQKGIAEAGYIDCMPVQEQVLSHAFGGQDLYVQSQTGTGKTAAFLVVIFQRLLTEHLLAGKKALIMAPTRELAVQIEEEAKMLGKYLPFRTGSFYGGVGYTQQEKMLRENVQIMAGTPGRVLDLNKSGKMNLMETAFLVLDEADRMFDMGFYPDLGKLIKVVPPADRRQTMLFSATLNAWVKNLAWEYTHKPFEIEIKPEVVTVEEVEQILYHVSSGDKMKLLLGILEHDKPESAIIFCNTKRYTEIVAKRLKINGSDCEFIIGDLPQSRRLKIIDDVKAGKTKFLVATDVAARGLDIEDLAMVVNYDLPVEAENYVHRIGRTARAGKTGRAITLASEQDVYELPAIERYIGGKIPSEIAMPNLYAADKSAGQHIRADEYDEAKPGRGCPQVKSGGNYSGKKREYSKGGGRKAFSEKNLGTGKNNWQDARRGKPAGSAQKTEDLSRLSFDERMALYKQKYDSKQDAGSSARSPAGVTEKKGKSASTVAAKSASAVKSARKKRTQAKPGTAAAKGKSAGRKSGGKSVVAEKGEKAPVKKGFFSRLLGIFGKKES